ncbi:zinc-binding alcohol dehydrogenase family protein [Aspergillus thermomutatus]|uniref:Enoyl reductase (ER) domain-containing protein n=1 Tax=Aspergillus thermomutatus TaxID=41047 RepID=A0A397GCF8_ASPTH|nr:uncharacterized protein CDV56_103619 [Aspergillus thermomutatus]RHZ48127.1 hypothetical protein CDV56_103619 [Aspergillus thermomutatus]
MKAVKIQEVGKAAVAEVPTPQKHIHLIPSEGCTSGSDFAGVVQEVGSNVTTLKKGDRIAGVAHGGNSSHKEDGAFAEYVAVKEGISFKLPDGVSFEEAATGGVGIATIGQGLYQSLQLPLPNQPSKERFPSLGADAVFDYNAPNCGAEIRKHTSNELYYAFDCISEGNPLPICAEALSSDVSTKKPMYSSVLFCEFPRTDSTLAYTIFGEPFYKAFGAGIDFPASKEDYDFAKMFFKLSERLLAEGKFKFHRVDVRNGGLEGVLEGLEELRQGKVSGKKLVYRITDIYILASSGYVPLTIT